MTLLIIKLYRLFKEKYICKEKIGANVEMLKACSSKYDS